MRAFLSVPYFLLLVSITHYVLSENITPCPDKCTCTKLSETKEEKRVDCTREKLTAVPPASTWPANIYILDLSMNDIQRIDVMESNSDLEYLDLATNNIEVIEPSAFEHLQSLLGIDLSHNQLETIPVNLFDSLVNLQSLNISYNNIQQLPNDLFSKSTYLQDLRLSHNPLRVLNGELFYHLSQLKVLDMSGIDAFALKDGLFHTLNELIELDLSDNEFMMVPTHAIRSARKLAKLKLNGNPIKFIDEHSFVKMSTLQELYLDNMKELTEVKEKTFTHLVNAKKISISNNPHLSYLDKYAFNGMYNKSWLSLQEIDLSANRLSSLPEQTLPWCNITTIDLRLNPWMCDCNIQWIKHCHLKPELSVGVICAYPSRLRGHELSTIDHEELICEHSEIYREVKMMRLFVIVFASFVLFSIGLLFVLFIKRDQVLKWCSDKRRGTGAIYYVKAHSNPIDPDI